jgi:hypothetical protein
VLPRYRGTWESGGMFLKNEPTDDIEEVINLLHKPHVSLMEGKSYSFPKNPRIYLFVGSFGGPAGLFLSKDPRVKRVFAYSPVVDWEAPMPTEPVKGFAKATKLLFGEGYRIDPRGEAKLISGKFYNPASAPYEVDGKKVHIFHTKDDEIIAYDPVERFAKQVCAKFTGFSKGGHGGASSFMEPRVWKYVVKELGK